MSAKLNERLVFSAPAEWVPMDQYRQVIGVARAAEASPATAVSVQLRKATDAAGSNPANLGTVVSAGTEAVAHANASDLGATNDGVPYTHVSATVTGVTGVVIRGDGRFNP